MKFKNELSEEIRSEIEELSKMEVGTDQYKIAVDGTTKLMDRVIEIDKFEAELQEKARNQEIENELKLKAMHDEQKDRLIKNILTGVGMITTVALTVWGTVTTLNFEKEGTVTTIMGRGFINKLLPKK